MRTVVLALLLAVSGLRPAHADDAQDHYENGVEAARGGDHGTAITHLLASLEAGGRHPAVYHALGNALYRRDHLGHAIAAWHRAAALEPRNRDIQANLDRATQKSTDQLEGVSGDLFFWQAVLSPAEGGLLAGLLVALAIASAALRNLRARAARIPYRPGVTPIVLLFLAALPAISTTSSFLDAGDAIVVVPEVTARSALGPGGVDLFVLHAGAAVAVAERADGDTLAALPDDRKGWLPTSALVSTDPADPFPSPPAMATPSPSAAP